MNRFVFSAIVLLVLTGCGYTEVNASGSKLAPLVTDSGVRISATTERLWISTHPLGDVVLGEMQSGDAATAFCFVPVANTNTGAMGTAVQIDVGGERGYVAVEITDPDSGEVLRFVDKSSAWLESRLPSCRLADGRAHER